MKNKKRIVTGDRPTGRLHIGHYFGSLKKRVELQNSEEYEQYLESLDVDLKNKEEKYWDFVQGHPNPYGKEFYDYVESHKNIKFSSNPEIARKEMKEVNYKMHADPMHEDIPTLLCEKSTVRILLELGLSLLDSI